MIQNTANEKSLDNKYEKQEKNPKAYRRKIRKKLQYFDPLDEPGTIYNAEVHQSAQRLLKVKRITKYVKFCKCCSLPQETPGVVEPFNYFDDSKGLGLGIYLYFYYIKFCIIMSIMCIGLSSISTIVFSKQYSSDIKNYCNSTIKEVTNETVVLDKNTYNFHDLLDDCNKFVDIDENILNDYKINVSDAIKFDWMNKMSSYNLKYYYNVFKYGADPKKYDNIDKIILDYSFMYFLTGISFLIANYILILHINLLDLIENFKLTTPSDYSLLIHGVPNPQNGVKIKDELINIIKEVSFFESNFDVYHIIPCLKIGDIYDVAKQKYEDKRRLYHLYNFEKQKMLNKENNFNENNLHYFKGYIFFHRKIPVKEIEKRIIDNNNKLEELIRDLNNNPNNFNGGTFIIVFSTMEMKEKFYDFFPHSFIGKSICYIKYFFICILLKKCFNENKKKITKLKIKVDVSLAPEPYEIQWEYMGYTRTQRNIRKLISFVASIALIIIAFILIVFINWIQNTISKKQKIFLKYVLSFSVSIVLAITNVIGKLVLKELTLMEKIEIKTDFYISYSLKQTVFNFVTIAIIPVLSNFIQGWGNSDVLVNNLLMIFVIDILIQPILFYLGIGLVIKKCKRTKAKANLLDVEFEKSIYTQGELNEMFENPEMDISSKYAYISNAVLIPLFYMSIFPIGMIFGFGGLLFAYLAEFIYLGLYKRPEVLNSKLCIFYVSNFKWAIFIFSLGNYIFLSPLNKNQRLNWSLVNLILFFVLCMIPYQSFKINAIGLNESNCKSGSYLDNYYYFSTDYEKMCPFTRINGYKNYFQNLINDGIVEREKGERIINNVQNTNEMAAYIKTKRHIDNYCSSQELNNSFMHKRNKYFLY